MSDTTEKYDFRLAASLCAALLLAVFLKAAPCSAESDIYFYIDADGNYFFSNVPTDDRYNPSEINFISNRPDRLKRRSNDVYDPVIRRAAQMNNVDFALVKAVIKAESGFNPRAVSRAGAQGLMQIMPSNFESFGIANPFDPEENIGAGTRYLKYLMDRYDQDLQLALAAYNAGPSVVDRYSGIPPFPETRQYIERVLTYYERLAHTR